MISCISNSCQDPAAFLSAIHSQGCVSFCTNKTAESKKLKAIGSIPINLLSQQWERIQSYTSGTCYFSLNSTNDNGWQAPYMPTGYLTKRTAENIGWLNALWIDLDCHHGEDLQKVIADTEQIIINNNLPRPTFETRSGRGLWLIWQFSEPMKTSEYSSLWKRCAQSLYEIFRPLGKEIVDRDSILDITRVMRLPGSINQNTNSQVKFFQTGSTHRFDDLCKAFAVHALPTAVLPAEQFPAKQKNKASQKAARARWAKMHDGLKGLLALRGHVPEGQRHSLVWALAVTGRKAGLGTSYTERLCREIGNAHNLEPEEVDRKIQAGFKIRNLRSKEDYLSYDRLQQMFRITPSELQAIPQLSKRPAYQPQNKKEKTIAIIKSTIAELGYRPNASALYAILKAKNVPISRKSVYAYYELIFCVNLNAIKTIVYKPVTAKTFTQPVQAIKPVFMSEISDMSNMIEQNNIFLPALKGNHHEYI